MVYVKELKPPEIWVRKYQKPCPFLSQKDPATMSSEELKKEILMLLFNEEFQMKTGAADRELLTIIIRKDKVHFFNFLKAYTTWKVVGLWEGEEEKNAQIDIEFRDTPDECIGNRLMHLFWEYNRKQVKEDVLYARTTPIEEGTLFA